MTDAATMSPINSINSINGAVVTDSFEVEVRVLGPVEIWGLERPIKRSWATELIVYLAMHRRAVSNEVWATALWPDKLMAASGLHSLTSVARRSLGRGENGMDHLPRARGHLRLADSVGTDWMNFKNLADNGLWEQALQLVRGRPFESLRYSDWPVMEGWVALMESEITSVALYTAEKSLAKGDFETAQWAARKALSASPYDERLYCLLMRAADLAGYSWGVEAVMKELVKVMELDSRLGDDQSRHRADNRRGLANRCIEQQVLNFLHPQTVELYLKLSKYHNCTRSV